MPLPRQVEFECVWPSTASQRLGGMVKSGGEIRFRYRMKEIRSLDFELRIQSPVLEQKEAALMGNPKQLVWIDRECLGTMALGKQSTHCRAKDSRATPGGINMEPETILFAD